jgi:hypothetical protein
MPGDVSEKDVEMKMKEIVCCLERSTASFEPKAVVKAFLQDVANAKKKRRQGGSCLPEKENPDGIHCWTQSWHGSIVDSWKDVINNVIKNNRISQIALSIPSTALLHRDKKALNPLFKICDKVGCSCSLLRSGLDHCQVPCMMSGIGSDDPTNSDSLLIELQNSKRCKTKNAFVNFAGESRGGLLPASVDDILKSRASLVALWNTSQNSLSQESVGWSQEQKII